MRKLGIEPTEHIQAATFWAKVKKMLKVEVVENEVLPCECAV